MADPTTPLDGERYINLETFRKDGSGVKTPVWAAPLEGKLVVMTLDNSFKVKRLHNNPRCAAAACDVRGNVRGPWYPGTARFVEDPAGLARIADAFSSKYGWQWKLATFLRRLSFSRNARVYIELTLGSGQPSAAA